MHLLIRWGTTLKYNSVAMDCGPPSVPLQGISCLYIKTTWTSPCGTCSDFASLAYMSHILQYTKGFPNGNLLLIHTEVILRADAKGNHTVGRRCGIQKKTPELNLKSKSRRAQLGVRKYLRPLSWPICHLGSGPQNAWSPGHVWRPKCFSSNFLQKPEVMFLGLWEGLWRPFDAFLGLPEA